MRSIFAGVFVCLFSMAAVAAAVRLPDVATNARHADKVVVAVVEDVQSRFATNEFGDRLIVSEVWLRVEETLKGTPGNLLSVEVEGGTVGDLTLRVSDLPQLTSGARGVFFLDAVDGGHKPHGRGEGILRLDSSGLVAGTQVPLADVRASVKASQK